jgi:hypothetical protein
MPHDGRCSVARHDQHVGETACLGDEWRRGVDVLGVGRPYQHIVQVPYEEACAVALQQMTSLPLEQLDEFATVRVIVRPTPSSQVEWCCS